MHIELLYVDGCPNWPIAHARLEDTFWHTGFGDEPIDLIEVTTPAQATALAFPGSPTIRINGHDPFRYSDDDFSALKARVYLTPDGPAGAPTREQLIHAIMQATDHLS
jgi:hypothetical protein